MGTAKTAPLRERWGMLPRHMNRVLIVLAFVACKDDKPAAPAAQTPTPSPTVPADAAVFDACSIARAALAGAKCEKPDDAAGLQQAKRALDGIVETVGQIGAGSPQQFHAACAQLLIALERDTKRTTCTLAFTPAQRGDVVQMLETWYAQRTPVEPTGDAAADAFIAKLAAVRDDACKCEKAACLDQLTAKLQAVGAVPQNAPEAARSLASKLLEDAGRCAARVRTLTDPS